jgi:hypothetical protein
MLLLGLSELQVKLNISAMVGLVIKKLILCLDYIY